VPILGALAIILGGGEYLMVNVKIESSKFAPVHDPDAITIMAGSL
jgi:hypothetical protein